MCQRTLFITLLAIFFVSSLSGCCSCFLDGLHRASESRRQNIPMTNIPPVKTDLNIEAEFHSANPPAGDSAVLVDAKVYVFFKNKKEMMARNESTIFILRDQYGRAVEGEISCDRGLMVFYPAANFQPGWNYRVTIGEVGYENGNRMKGSKSWVFTAKK